jgi:thiol:disulfide interchange protein
MRTFFLAFLLTFTTGELFSQDMTKFNLYHPAEDAEKALDEAIDRAKDEKKHVFVQIGGNWCVWCARFNDFVTSDKSIDSVIQANYIVYHLNYSKENKNGELLKRYKFPQRFGFPVFLVLDGKGELLHTQNSWYLESGKSYDKEKVMAFLNDWSPAAMDPRHYKDDQ